VTSRRFLVHPDEFWPWYDAIFLSRTRPAPYESVVHLDVTDEELATYRKALGVVLAMQERIRRAREVEAGR